MCRSKLTRTVHGEYTLPADFATRARRARNPDLAAHYGVCIQTIFKWRRESSVKGNPGRSQLLPMPDGFTDVAVTTRNADLCERYGVCLKVVTRWRREAGLKSEVRGRAGTAKRPVPNDFRNIAPGSSIKGLRRRYGCGRATLTRWFEEAGLPQPERKPGPAPKPKRLKEKAVRATRTPVPRRKREARLGRMGHPHGSTIVNLLQRDDSLEGQAADHLRRVVAVYRCAPGGSADPAGSHWRYGNTVLTGEELVARARRNGFDPDAWQHIPNPRREGFARFEGA